MTSSRKKSHSDNETRASIITATEQIMFNEGHSAVSTRRIAEILGIKSPLIHYYFKSMDDLFAEIFKVVEEKYITKLRNVSKSPKPMRELWDINVNYNEYETKMMMEFIALSSSSKSISKEGKRATENIRSIELEIITSEISKLDLPEDFPSPLVISFFLSGAARRIIQERQVGVEYGHREIIDVIERFVDDIDRALKEPGHEVSDYLRI